MKKTKNPKKLQLEKDSKTMDFYLNKLKQVLKKKSK